VDEILALLAEDQLSEVQHRLCLRYM
jgi:hypothetical protein